MSDVAHEYLQELERRREEYESATDALESDFKQHDRRPPGRFRDSSFLYIRSYDGDLGVRPFSGIVHWRSPDLVLSPVTSVGAYTTAISAGETYRVRCALRNRGDLAVPSAKVELFLTDPTLGFDTRFATDLTLGNVPSAWVGSSANAVAEFLWTVPGTEAGHKCLFARAFSFSPLERPVDPYALDPRIDRHVAQQNLNIAGQAQSYSFKLVHAPTARVRIELRALSAEELLGLRHPVLADVRPAKEIPDGGWGEMAGIELADAGATEVSVETIREGIRFESLDRDGFDLDAQREVRLALRRLVSAGRAGGKRSRDRGLFARLREMRSQTRRSSFTMNVPDVGLQPGEAVGLDITATDETLEEPEVFGGITLVIVGE